MRARLALAGLTVAFLILGLASGSSFGPSQGTALASGGCLDGSQPYNGGCCIDHECRKTYPPIPLLGGTSASLTTPLSGAEQSETSAGDPNGTGSASFQLYPSKEKVCFSVSHSNVAPTNAGHIHKGARGTSGPVVVNLYTSLGVASSISGCVTADPVTISDIIGHPRQYYVQLHNGGYPLGVIRGQLGD